MGRGNRTWFWFPLMGKLQVICGYCVMGFPWWVGGIWRGDSKLWSICKEKMKLVMFKGSSSRISIWGAERRKPVKELRLCLFSRDILFGFITAICLLLRKTFFRFWSYESLSPQPFLADKYVLKNGGKDVVNAHVSILIYTRSLGSISHHKPVYVRIRILWGVASIILLQVQPCNSITSGAHLN